MFPTLLAWVMLHKLFITEGQSPLLLIVVGSQYENEPM